MTKEKTLTIDNSQEQVTNSQPENSIELESPKSTLPEQSAYQNTQPVLDSLKEWAQSILTDDESQTNSMPTVNLSRFGLKTAEDVAIFMTSPAGESISAEIETEIEIEESQQKYVEMEQREHELMLHRLKVALFLWYVEEKAEAAKKVQEIVIEQNEKAIQHSGKTPTSSSIESQRSDLRETIANYDKAIQISTEQLNESVEQEKVLVQQMETLVQEGKDLEDKFKHYNSALDNIEPLLEKLEQSEDIHAVDAEMDQIKEVLKKKLVQIDQFIEARKDEDVSRLIKENTALNLQIASHEQMLAVKQGKKHFLDEHGKRVNTFKSAHFILDTPPDLNQAPRIVKENGKYYLLKPGQDWNDVKDNPEQKQEAQTRFEDRKLNLLTVKKTMQHHDVLEKGIHLDRIGTLDKRISERRLEQMQLKNQINLLQSARAEAQSTLNEQNPNRPTPTPSVSSVARPSSPTSSYRVQVQQLIQQHRFWSQDQLMKLAQQAPGSIRGTFGQYLQSQFARNEFKNIPRTAPIPPVMMQFLMKNLPRFGVVVDTPDNAPSPQKEEELANSPLSPFKTTPDPYK